MKIFFVHKIPIEADDLRKSILTDLESIWGFYLEKTFILELHQAKAAKLLKGISKYQRYQFFIEALTQKNNQLYFLKRYPIIEKKFKLLKKLYLEYFTELCSRLHKDRLLLSKKLHLSSKETKLKAIRFSGDPHNNFRRVAILEFTGLAPPYFVVYKPRPIDNEIFFQKIIAAVNKKLSKKIKVYDCLSRKDYGWCEYISYNDCYKKSEIHNYYYRFGALSLITHILCVYDIHYENLIASGEYPVIIDLECIASNTMALQKAHVEIEQNILSTGMLPTYIFERNSGVDISAFGGGGTDCEIPFESTHVVNLGCDTMRLTKKSRFFTLQKNRPTLNQTPVEPFLFKKDILLGFEEAYDCIVSQKKILANIVAEFKNKLQARMIFRPTAFYLKLVSESYHPFLFRDQKKYESHINWLKGIPLTTGLDKKLEIFLKKSELNQIHQGDVPLFYIKNNFLHSGDNKKIPNASSFSIHKAIFYNLDKISAADRHIQRCLLEKSIDVRAINYKNPEPTVKKQGGLSHKRLLKRALSILDDLYDTRIDKEKFTWPQHKMQSVNKKNYWFIATSDISLYSGYLGILLVTVYVYKTTKNIKFQNRMTEGFDYLERFIINLEGNVTNADLSLFGGLSGLLYLCAHSVDVSCEIQIMKIIKITLNVISSHMDKWLAYNNFDIISGVAGLLMVMSLLKSKMIFLPVVEQIIFRAKIYLLENYENPQKLPASKIPNAISKPLLGFSHGVSGIALSLYRTEGPLQPNKKVIKWVKRALSYERKYFSNEHHNWPNFIKGLNVVEDKANLMQSDWCHGALGIGLSRIEFKKLGWKDKVIDQEIFASIKTVKNTGSKSILNLCHGELGRYEFFSSLYKNKLINKRTFVSMQKNIIEQLSQKSLVTEGCEEVYIPGLMTGKAGLVYTILRILYPEIIPSILMLE